MATYVPTFLGFLSETLERYDFGFEEASFLHWFHRFSSSGKMEFQVNSQDKKIYYRVSYQKVLRDFPFLKISPRKVSYYFGRLCGVLRDTSDKEALCTVDSSREYPLHRMIFADKKQGGSQVFFAINEKGFQQFLPEALEWHGEEEYRGEPEKEGGPQALQINGGRKQRPKPTKDITAVTRRLVEKLLGAEDSPFRHRLNAPGEPTSWLFLRVEELFIALVGGAFPKLCPLEESWVAHVDLGILEPLRNSWETLEEYLLAAQEVYKKWIRESRDASLLTRDLSRWLYNPVTKKSLFLSCIGRAHTQRSFAAEKLREASFDPETRKLLEEFLEKHSWWDATAYWLSMKTIYSYLHKNWYELRERNRESWSVRRIAQMIRNYLIFLDTVAKVDPNNLGYGRFLWQKFVEDYFNSCGVDVGEQKKLDVEIPVRVG